MVRFDFVLSGTDASSSFTLNLEEGRTGEILMGRNVPLVSTPTPSGAAVPRQDIGTRVRADFSMSGDDIVLHTNFEMSSADAGSPVSLRKLTASGDLPATPGKSTVVLSVDDDKKHHLELRVTPTRIP